MRRTRATELLELVLRQAQGNEWPITLIREIHVFGSYARGALEPADVDVAVFRDRDEKWTHHFVECLSYGRDPYSPLRTALRGRRRGISFLFDPEHGHDDIPMTLLWKRGQPLEKSLERLHSIAPDPAAGRAPRDAMAPCFEQLDHWLPRFVREELLELVENGVVTVDQVILEDTQISDPEIRFDVDQRWKDTSPLRRAAHAALAHLEGRGVDIHGVHLHGQDVDKPRTPNYVGFECRRLNAAISCFQEHHGVEWLEIAHPTPRGPLRALRIRPGDPHKVANHRSRPGAYFA